MRNNIFAFIVFLFCLGGSSSFAQQDEFLKDYLTRWENSKKYLLLIAEAMPEESYGFKATQEEMSFGAMLAHIAWAMDWHAQTLIGGRKEEEFPAEKRRVKFTAENRSKKEIIELMGQTFDDAGAVIKNFDASRLSQTMMYGSLQRTKRQIFLILADHVTHHRAQLVVYMRMKGLISPQYFLYQ